jgi:hypothetical protein
LGLSIRGSVEAQTSCFRHPFTNLNFLCAAGRLAGAERKIESTFFSNKWFPKAAPSPGCQPHIFAALSIRRFSANVKAIVAKDVTRVRFMLLFISKAPILIFHRDSVLPRHNGPEKDLCSPTGPPHLLNTR